jgi:FMN phosphatase YigB (HAD superfamily)
MTGHGLIDFFKSVVISGEVLRWKPDPEIFHIALRETGLGPNEVFYVGDTPEDVAGARAAGITPVLIQRLGNETDLDTLDYPSGSIPSRSERRDTYPDVMKVMNLQELLAVLN